MKKQFKSGFTLAEVLITIAVIGVVAALTMPNMITSYQYKSIGTKLSKFASQTENSARAFVVSNDVFRINGVERGTASDPIAFANESFLRNQGEAAMASHAFTAANAINRPTDGTLLKDGTRVFINVNPNATGDNALNANVDRAIYGQGAFALEFQPVVRGLPDSAQKAFHFVVTELGYIFPATQDACLTRIVHEDYNTTSALFTADGAVCRVAAQ